MFLEIRGRVRLCICILLYTIFLVYTFIVFANSVETCCDMLWLHFRNCSHVHLLLFGWHSGASAFKCLCCCPFTCGFAFVLTYMSEYNCHCTCCMLIRFRRLEWLLPKLIPHFAFRVFWLFHIKYCHRTWIHCAANRSSHVNTSGCMEGLGHGWFLGFSIWGLRISNDDPSSSNSLKWNDPLTLRGGLLWLFPDDVVRNGEATW